jgi:hypothetical protein
MSDEETSNCLKGPSDRSKNTCLNSQDKTKTDFVGTAVKEKKIGSKLCSVPLVFEQFKSDDISFTSEDDE